MIFFSKSPASSIVEMDDAYQIAQGLINEHRKKSWIIDKRRYYRVDHGSSLLPRNIFLVERLLESAGFELDVRVGGHGEVIMQYSCETGTNLTLPARPSVNTINKTVNTVVDLYRRDAEIDDDDMLSIDISKSGPLFEKHFPDICGELIRRGFSVSIWTAHELNGFKCTPQDMITIGKKISGLSIHDDNHPIYEMKRN